MYNGGYFNEAGRVNATGETDNDVTDDRRDVILGEYV